MPKTAALAASIVLAASSLTSCASTVRAEDAPTYVTVSKSQSFNRDARNGDRVHFSITIAPSDLVEHRLAGGGELTDSDIRGGLPGWENADGTALDRPVSPSPIPFAEASKNIFKGSRPFVIVVDISTGELIEGDGGPMSESRRVRRAFRVVGQTASKSRQGAIDNLLTREVIDTSVVVEEGADPAMKRIFDFTGLARAVTNVMVAAPSTSMMMSQGQPTADEPEATAAPDDQG